MVRAHPAGGRPTLSATHQMQTWILPTIRGEQHECYAITEAGAGCDVDAIEATARRDGDDYVLNGEKMHVTSFNTRRLPASSRRSSWAGRTRASTRCSSSTRPVRGAARARARVHAHLPGLHAVVAFEDVRVPAANLHRRGRRRHGFTCEWFRYERLMIAARCCGAAERLIDEATGFADGDVQFGKPIIENQAISFMLADSLTELWAARLMTYRLAENIDAGVDVKIQPRAVLDGQALR